MGDNELNIHNAPQNQNSLEYIEDQHVPVPVFKILPSLTDSAIDDWLDEHYVFFDPTVEPKGRLLVYLSGSFSSPGSKTSLVLQAAQDGYHTISLSYPNSWTVGSLCKNNPDKNCHANIRLEIIDGVKRSDSVSIGCANCISNRLLKLLSYLNSKFKDQGWSQYLNQGGINWSSIIVAGHSQGGGEAAMLAKKYRLAKAILLAAPADRIRGIGPVPWLLWPSATPSDQYFGFVHIKDRGARRILRAWKFLGLKGAPINVDNKPPPYRNSHRLFTNCILDSKENFHGSVVYSDIAPKRADGRPLFSDVWKYLLAR